MLKWATIIRPGQIWSEARSRGDLVATVYGSEDDYAADTCHVMIWPELHKKTITGRNYLEKAREYVTRFYRFRKPPAFRRTPRRPAKPAINYDQFDAYVKPAAHEFTNHQKPISKLSEIFDSVSAVDGGL